MIIFPIPFSMHKIIRDGLLFKTPTICQNCFQKCLEDTERGEHLCSFGYNYYTVDKQFTILGYINKSASFNSQAREKRLRDSKTNLVDNRIIQSIVQTIDQTKSDEKKDNESATKNKVYEEISKLDYKDTIEKYVTEGNKETLRCVFHDFRHFASEIIQNMNLFILDEQTGGDFDEKVDNSPYHIQAAFHAAKLMTTCLDSYAYTENPTLLLSASEISRFRPHSLLLKILRIYRSSFDEKEIKTSVTGKNILDIISNEKAVPILMLTLIDNAKKYAPRGSRVQIEFQDTSNSVIMRVISEGPRIEKDELTKIFTIYYRGRNIPKEEYSGSGFGLYSLAVISKKLDISYLVEQDKQQRLGFYETEFSLTFPTRIVY